MLSGNSSRGIDRIPGIELIAFPGEPDLEPARQYHDTFLRGFAERLLDDVAGAGADAQVIQN